MLFYRARLIFPPAKTPSLNFGHHKFDGNYFEMHRFYGKLIRHDRPCHRPQRHWLRATGGPVQASAASAIVEMA